jgi:hypothetical protein
MLLTLPMKGFCLLYRSIQAITFPTSSQLRVSDFIVSPNPLQTNICSTTFGHSIKFRAQIFWLGKRRSVYKILVGKPRGKETTWMIQAEMGE